MSQINRIPVMVWILLVSSFTSSMLYFTASQTVGIILFFATPISYVPRLYSPAPLSKREEVGLALLMRPIGYVLILIISLIIQILGLYSYSCDWIQKKRSLVRSTR